MENNKCECCAAPAMHSILLAEGCQGKSSLQINRFYIPNEFVRERIPETNVTREVWFCVKCMRVLEDNLRATMLYLQAENNLLTIAERR